MKDVFNLPNTLTNIRIILVPIFIFFLLKPGFLFKSIALGVFLIASITDYYDGLIARKRQLITTYGIFMDPLADKILLGSAFISFLFTERLGFDMKLSVWMILPIVIREIGITILRSYLIYHKINLPANIWGKIKTVLQMVTVIYILLMIFSKSLLNYLYQNIFKETFYMKLESILKDIPWYLLLITMIITVITGLQYIFVLINRRRNNEIGD